VEAPVEKFDPNLDPIKLGDEAEEQFKAIFGTILVVTIAFPFFFGHNGHN